MEEDPAEIVTVTKIDEALRAVDGGEVLMSARAAFPMRLRDDAGWCWKRMDGCGCTVEGGD